MPSKKIPHVYEVLKEYFLMSDQSENETGRVPVIGNTVSKSVFLCKQLVQV